MTPWLQFNCRLETMSGSIKCCLEKVLNVFSSDLHFALVFFKGITLQLIHFFFSEAMSTFFASTILVFSVLVSPVVLRWVNEYDKDLKFECPRGEHLSRLESQHSNKREDRVWNFECRNGFVTANCIWTGNQNSFDRALNFKCKDNGLIVGLSSWHHNAREDRVWQFKCCKVG